MSNKIHPMAGQAYKALPLDFNTVAGGGAGGFLGQVVNGSWAKLPTYYYDLFRTQAPVPAAEFNSKFGGVVNLFDIGTQDESRQTNATTGRTVNEIFCAVGASIVAVGEGEAFSVPGASYNRSNLPERLVDGEAPIVDACGNDLSSPTVGTPAVLQWGSPIWTAIEKMFLGYRFQMYTSRFLLVDELLMDIGMSPSPPEFIGSGDMRVAGMPGVRDTNDVMSAKGIDLVFVPPTPRAATVEEDSCTGAPLVPAMKGHPRIVGLSNRVYCFNHPICFFPGMTFQANFVQTEQTLIEQARNSLGPRFDSADALFTSPRSVTIPGGTLHMGLVLKGFALQPQAALDYLTSYLPRLSGSWSELYAGNPVLGNIIRNASAQNPGLLQGIPPEAMRLLASGGTPQ